METPVKNLLDQFLKIKSNKLDQTMQQKIHESIEVLSHECQLPFSAIDSPVVSASICLLTSQNVNKSFLSSIIISILNNVFSESALSSITTALKLSLDHIDDDTAILFLQQSPTFVCTNFPNLFLIQSFFSICINLTSNKAPAISSIAIACFQQLLSSILEGIGSLPNECYEEVRNKFNQQFNAEKQYSSLLSEFANPSILILYLIFSDLTQAILSRPFVWIQSKLPTEEQLFTLLDISVSLNSSMISIITSNSSISTLFEIVSIQSTSNPKALTFILSFIQIINSTNPNLYRSLLDEYVQQLHLKNNALPLEFFFYFTLSSRNLSNECILNCDSSLFLSLFSALSNITNRNQPPHEPLALSIKCIRTEIESSNFQLISPYEIVIGFLNSFSKVFIQNVDQNLKTIFTPFFINNFNMLSSFLEYSALYCTTKSFSIPLQGYTSLLKIANYLDLFNQIKLSEFENLLVFKNLQYSFGSKTKLALWNEFKTNFISNNPEICQNNWTLFFKSLHPFQDLLPTFSNSFSPDVVGGLVDPLIDIAPHSFIILFLRANSSRFSLIWPSFHVLFVKQISLYDHSASHYFCDIINTIFSAETSECLLQTINQINSITPPQVGTSENSENSMDTSSSPRRFTNISSSEISDSDISSKSDSGQNVRISPDKKALRELDHMKSHILTHLLQIISENPLEMSNAKDWLLLFSAINPSHFTDQKKSLVAVFNIFSKISGEHLIQAENLLKPSLNLLFDFCKQTTDINVALSSIDTIWSFIEPISKSQEVDSIFSYMFEGFVNFFLNPREDLAIGAMKTVFTILSSSISLIPNNILKLLISSIFPNYLRNSETQNPSIKPINEDSALIGTSGPSIQEQTFQEISQFFASFWEILNQFEEFPSVVDSLFAMQENYLLTAETHEIIANGLHFFDPFFTDSFHQSQIEEKIEKILNKILDFLGKQSDINSVASSSYACLISSISKHSKTTILLWLPLFKKIALTMPSNSGLIHYVTQRTYENLPSLQPLPQTETIAMENTIIDVAITTDDIILFRFMISILIKCSDSLEKENTSKFFLSLQRLFNMKQNMSDVHSLFCDLFESIFKHDIRFETNEAVECFNLLSKIIKDFNTDNILELSTLIVLNNITNLPSLNQTDFILQFSTIEMIISIWKTFWLDDFNEELLKNIFLSILDRIKNSFSTWIEMKKENQIIDLLDIINAEQIAKIINQHSQNIEFKDEGKKQDRPLFWYIIPLLPTFSKEVNTQSSAIHQKLQEALILGSIASQFYFHI